MGVDTIKKNKPMPQVDPRTIPGYYAPPELSGQPPRQVAQQRQAVRQVFPAQGETQPGQAMGYDLQPARQAPAAPAVWVSRHFKTEACGDIGSWLTEIERTTGVLGIASAYAPGGVVVVVKTREAV